MTTDATTELFRPARSPLLLRRLTGPRKWRG